MCPISAVSNISGEVYEILDEELIKSLDKLEMHPNWYVRSETSIKLENQNKVETALIYYNYHILPPFIEKDDIKIGTLIESGDYREYIKQNPIAWHRKESVFNK